MRQVRKRVFMGCQGDSERSYSTLLHRLFESRFPLHVDSVPLSPGAGDPLDTVEQAVKQIKKREQYGRYLRKFILLDIDQMGLAPARDNACTPLAMQNKISLIWQHPSHEGFLMQHFNETRGQQPCSAQDALRRLRRIWPEYYKAMSTDQLARRIGLDEIISASEVCPDFRLFLIDIGVVRPVRRTRHKQQS